MRKYYKMSKIKNIGSWFEGFINLFYPRLCQACHCFLIQNEKQICTKCLFHLPKTNFHLQEKNPVSEIFWGRVKLEYAASFFTFAKGSKYQKLIHKLKYHNLPEIGIVLGKHLGFTLQESPFYQDIDLIIPVPMHPKKMKIRGYNQAELIAKGLSEIMKVPVYTDQLIKEKHTESQTKKRKSERWKNVEKVFKIKDDNILENQHILLVDDVVTTGATLDACANCILQIKGARVSIATLAYA